MTMNLRRLALGFLTLLACSRSPEDAGIVLNVDTEVMADRTLIDRITVTVDGRRQEWLLRQPLPGSLGIETSPGNKSVTVEGFAKTVLRGTWTKLIVAGKGKVVVQDVHLSAVVAPTVDGGPSSLDSGGREVSDTGTTRDGTLDTGGDSADGAGRDVVAVGMDGAGEVSGRDSGSGRDTFPVFLDAGAAELSGRDSAADLPGADLGPDSGDTADSGVEVGADGPLSGDDGPALITSPFAGSLAVTSQFQVPATVATPGRLGDTLRLVHTLVDNPGAALLQFADEAGVPELATLRAVLPDALESRLPDWMDSYLKTATVNGTTPYEQFVTLDNIIQALLLNWELQSRLALPVATPGTHTPVALIFVSPTGPIPLDPTAQITPGVGVTATVSWPGGPNGAALMAISEHSMGLPFGRYAVQALDGILLAEYGAENLEAYLGNAVDCSGMADSVASRCVSILCVGHAAEVFAICQGGVSEGAHQIENQILALDFKAIHFEQGTATAVGSTVQQPQNATSLADGVWTATIDFGDGPQPATATFTAAPEVGAP
jgi:hypothetical protein